MAKISAPAGAKTKAKVPKQPEAKPAAPVLPWVRYDKFTVEQILDVCQRGGKAVKRRVLAYEDANQKRAEIVEPLRVALGISKAE